MTDTTPARQRQSFSCPQDLWDTCKNAWAASTNRYPAWTEWLEDAIAAGVADTRSRHGGQLENAPVRIPPGRRTAPDPDAPSRPRRSFTIRPDIWAAARDAWWTEREIHPQFSDWICAALADFAEIPAPESSNRTPPP